MTTMTDDGRVPADMLAHRLVLIRREMRLTQREAALLCGITYGEWQSMEDSRKAGDLPAKIQKIADATGYSRNWIMWGGPLAQSSPPDGGTPLPKQSGGTTLRKRKVRPTDYMFGTRLKSVA